MIDEEKIGKRIKDKRVKSVQRTEWSSKIDEKESDDKTVDLFFRFQEIIHRRNDLIRRYWFHEVSSTKTNYQITYINVLKKSTVLS